MERNDELLYDWNVKGDHISPPWRKVELHDETLRDGIQCPSVHDPDIDAKKDVVRLLDAVGAYSVNVGLPGAGPRAVADSTTLVEVIRDEGLSILPGAAARTHPNDIRPIISFLIFCSSPSPLRPSRADREPGGILQSMRARFPPARERGSPGTGHA